MNKRDGIIFIVLVLLQVTLLVWLAHNVPVTSDVKNDRQLDSIINVNNGSNKEIIKQQLELSQKLNNIEDQKIHIREKYHETIRIIERNPIVNVSKTTDSLFNYLSQLDERRYFEPIPIEVD